MNLDKLNENQHPSLVQARKWFKKINKKLGYPLPQQLFLGVLRKSFRNKAVGLSAILEFDVPKKTLKATLIEIHPRMLWCSTTWMAVLTHEITHLLNPDIDCGTTEHEDKVIELRRKVLDPAEWILM